MSALELFELIGGADERYLEHSERRAPRRRGMKPLRVLIAAAIIAALLCAAALGYAAVFGSASNTLLAPALIGAEVFGWAGAPAFLIACAAAYVVNGNRSIYSGQRA